LLEQKISKYLEHLKQMPKVIEESGDAKYLESEINRIVKLALADCKLHLDCLLDKKVHYSESVVVHANNHCFVELLQILWLFLPRLCHQI